MQQVCWLYNQDSRGRAYPHGY